MCLFFQQTVWYVYNMAQTNYDYNISTNISLQHRIKEPLRPHEIVYQSHLFTSLPKYFWSVTEHNSCLRAMFRTVYLASILATESHINYIKYTNILCSLLI